MQLGFWNAIHSVFDKKNVPLRVVNALQGEKGAVM